MRDIYFIFPATRLLIDQIYSDEIKPSHIWSLRSSNPIKPCVMTQHVMFDMRTFLHSTVGLVKQFQLSTSCGHVIPVVILFVYIQCVTYKTP